MEKLPRALQLADWLDEVNAAPHPIHTKSAAAELRRLHAALQAERERAAMICHQYRDWSDNPAEAIAEAILRGE
jgi:hypothetical protein